MAVNPHHAKINNNNKKDTSTPHDADSLSGAFLKHFEKNSNIGMQNLNHANKEFGAPKASIVDNKSEKCITFVTIIYVDECD